VLAAQSPLIPIARTTNDASILVDEHRLATARAKAPGSADYIGLHPFNFAISKSAITRVHFNPRQKWGTGPVPHSGRLMIDIRDARRRELILLGQQNGLDLLDRLRRLGYAA
jgi:hypothetical protein